VATPSASGHGPDKYGCDGRVQLKTTIPWPESQRHLHDTITARRFEHLARPGTTRHPYLSTPEFRYVAAVPVCQGRRPATCHGGVFFCSCLNGLGIDAGGQPGCPRGRGRLHFRGVSRAPASRAGKAVLGQAYEGGFVGGARTSRSRHLGRLSDGGAALCREAEGMGP